MAMSQNQFHSKGIDQGFPLSGLAFQFYTSDLVDTTGLDSSEDAIVFMDDTLLLAQGESLTAMNKWVKHMMTRKGGGLKWSHTHQCKFALDKFGIMGLTRRREPDPLTRGKTRLVQRRLIFLQGIKVPVAATHKFLGVMLDQELC